MLLKEWLLLCCFACVFELDYFWFPFIVDNTVPIIWSFRFGSFVFAPQLTCSLFEFPMEFSSIYFLFLSFFLFGVFAVCLFAFYLMEFGGSIFRFSVIFCQKCWCVVRRLKMSRRWYTDFILLLFTFIWHTKPNIAVSVYR